MILRKPYAFIIKHFRMIHMIILGCVLYLLFSLDGIYQLFNSLHSSNTHIYVGAYAYIDKMVYYFILGGLALSGTVFWLLYKKNKPTILYLSLIVYFLALFIGYQYLYSVLEVIQNEILSIDQVILVKDVANILKLPGYVCVAFCFIRGIGFNIKQFNFSKDIAELNIAESDSAEFEVLIGQNNYIYMRAIRRTLREIKYYFLENKFAFTCVGAGLAAVFIGFGVYYYNEFMKRLSESEVTSVNGISYIVNNSYMTEYDYNGNKVRDGYKYIVVNMNFHNSTDQGKKLNLDLITLKNGRLIYYPTLTKNSKFYDFGTPYNENQEIPSYDELEATLTFEIPKSVNTKNFTLRVQYAIESTLDNVVARYRLFDIKTQQVDRDPVVRQKPINETINVDTIGKNKFALVVEGYDLKDNYNNRYVICKKDLTCTPTSRIISSSNPAKDTMLIVSIKGTMYDDAKFTKTFNTYNKVFANYVELSYTLLNKEYVETLNIVPLSNVDGKIFASVDRRVTRADRIKLLFHFRNETYEVPLRGTYD